MGGVVQKVDVILQKAVQAAVMAHIEKQRSGQ